jgi:DNA repair protein RadA/Sms
MKSKTVFYCTSCGNETPRWQGQCPACGAWNTIVEFEDKPAPGASKTSGKLGPKPVPKRLGEIEAGSETRFSTGVGEFDRVLGGGGVLGSLVLVGGAPGIGKSTLMLQICTYLGKNLKILYVSGEESERQIKLRADRLKVNSENLFILSETDVDTILEAVSALSPDILIADSIQTLYSSENASAPGSISQVKDCTMKLMQLAKGSGVTVFVIGHINKEGAIAGPKVLEHMVDCVLYFEGEPSSNYRILRAAKNRFGSTNEIGVFEMDDTGLREVPNPSQMLLAGRPLGAPGTCVACAMEGTRPVLAEVQALVAKTSFNVPRRTTDGFDYNRANLLMAVLEKRGGLNVGMCDAYVNVIGGLQLDEPAADLAVVLAVASSYRDKPMGDATTAIGEVGLTGEVRAVTALQQRLDEAARLGFTSCVIPRHGTQQITAPSGMELIRVRNVREAIEISL